MSAKTRTLDLTEGPVTSRLLQFFFPILFGMLLQQLYNTVDAAVVGKFEGSNALAAVGGSTAVLINLVIGFVNGLAGGASVVISQFYGSRDMRRLSTTVHTVLTFYFFLGAALTLLITPFVPGILGAVNTPANILPLSTEYMRIYFYGLIPMFLYNLGSGILRAVGDSRRPLYYLAVCCFLNIGFNLLFVAVMKMGVAGVAWGTFISQSISAVLTVRAIARSRDLFDFSFRKLKIDWPSLRRTLTIGIPSGIQSSMYSISNILLTSSVNSLGSQVVAGWTIQSRLGGLYWVTTSAFGTAVCAFVGQCFGAGKKDRMTKSARVGLVLDAGAAVLISALLLIFGRLASRIFTDDPEVIENAFTVMRVVVPWHVAYAAVEILSAVLRGQGDTLRPTLIVVIGVCGIRGLWCLTVLPRWLSVQSISICYPISWVVTMSAMSFYYLYRKRRQKA